MQTQGPDLLVGVFALLVVAFVVRECMTSPWAICTTNKKQIELYAISETRWNRHTVIKIFFCYHTPSWILLLLLLL